MLRCSIERAAAYIIPNRGASVCDEYVSRVEGMHISHIMSFRAAGAPFGFLQFPQGLRGKHCIIR